MTSKVSNMMVVTEMMPLKDTVSDQTLISHIDLLFNISTNFN